MRYLIAIGVVLAILGVVFQTGRNYEAKKCQAAALQSQIRALQADLSAERSARADADRRAESIEADASLTERKVRELEQEVAQRPVQNRCSLSRADAERLRGNPRPKQSATPR